MTHKSKTVSTIIGTTFWTMAILTIHPFLQERVGASPSSTHLIKGVQYYEISFLNDGIRLLAIHTQPFVVFVGNVFKIHALVFNNSPGTISFIAGPCDSALSTTFDKNVVVKHGVGCFDGSTSSSAVQLVKLRPGQIAQIEGPSVGTTYQAVASGMTVALVTFRYQSQNGASASITKSFEFNIV